MRTSKVPPLVAEETPGRTDTPGVPAQPVGADGPSRSRGTAGSLAGGGDRSGPAGFPRSGPLLPPRRDRNLRRLKGVRGRAARRRTDTAVGLNAASAAPPTSRPRALSVSKRHRPRPGCPRVPKGAPGCPSPRSGIGGGSGVLSVPQSAAEPREHIRALPRGRKPRGGGCGEWVWAWQAGKMLMSHRTRCRISGNSGRLRAAGTRGAARQPFHVSRYKGAVAIRQRMFSVCCGGGRERRCDMRRK